jgi:protein SFI1
MESYQYVKREGEISIIIFFKSSGFPNHVTETMRRLFHRWLSLAISTRRRRLALQQKEEELKFLKIAAAWDKWRERFIDEKLRPTVR